MALTEVSAASSASPARGRSGVKLCMETSMLGNCGMRLKATLVVEHGSPNPHTAARGLETAGVCGVTSMLGNCGMRLKATLVVEHGSPDHQPAAWRLVTAGCCGEMTSLLKNAMQILRFVGSRAVASVGEKVFLPVFEGPDYTPAVF